VLLAAGVRAGVSGLRAKWPKRRLAAVIATGLFSASPPVLLAAARLCRVHADAFIGLVIAVARRSVEPLLRLVVIAVISAPCG